jgi:hypothetical protein
MSRLALKISKRPIVLATTIALGRGNVAILGVVILDGFRRRFPGFAVILAGEAPSFCQFRPCYSLWQGGSASFSDHPIIRDLNLTVFEAPG